MNSKFTLALIALVGVGVFALPSTMALFAGQHSFYNIDATGNQVPCVKCHGDVKAELSSGYSATTNTSGPHANFKCEYCHRAEAGASSGDDASAELTYAAVAPGTGSIKLVTTVQNFERGNFPKSITYRTGMNVSNWNATASDVQNLDGTNFVDQLAYRDYQGNYRGSLTTFGTAGTIYNYSSSAEVALRPNGVPKDTQSTKDAAFNPRAVNWTSSTAAVYDYAGSREVTPGSQYHAASLVSCMECHGGEKETGIAGYVIESGPPYKHETWIMNGELASDCNACHYGSGGLRERNLAAGGFGLTTYGNDTGSTEAHKDFVGATGGVLRFGYGAANDACVGCHTHVAVSINFQKKYMLTLDANAFTGGAGGSANHGNWSVGNFDSKGTVNVVEFGNGTGGAFATGPKDYNWTADKTLYLVNSNGTQGAQVTGMDHTTTDNSSALQTQ
ncbi:Cytochrome c7 c [uncultured archaeon]|nr:Cytochrome c7 c [uncultured archaeon]